MRPHCFSKFHLPVSFRGLVGQLSCAAQSASQPSQIKIRKLLHHRFLSGGFLLVMYNRRDRRVIPSRNSRGTFHPRGKRCHDSLDLFLITTTILPLIPLCYKILRQVCGSDASKKGSVKSVFFHIVSKILRHRLSTCKKSVSSLLAVKDTCLFLTYAGEILLLPLPTILDTYLRFLTTPGGIEGKTPFLHPV